MYLTLLFFFFSLSENKWSSFLEQGIQVVSSSPQLCHCDELWVQSCCMCSLTGFLWPWTGGQIFALGAQPCHVLVHEGFA